MLGVTVLDGKFAVTFLSRFIFIITTATGSLVVQTLFIYSYQHSEIQNFGFVLLIIEFIYLEQNFRGVLLMCHLEPDLQPSNLFVDIFVQFIGRKVKGKND